jgi:SRSO17 transposase
VLKSIIDNTETLNNFLQEFRPAFKNSPQFKLFQHYVVALLLYLGSKNLSGLSNVIPDGRSESSLYRFVASYNWDDEQVKACRLGILNRRTRRAIQAAQRRGEKVPVFVIIDDSLVKKTGKTMEGVAQHYSHTEHKQVLSHVWVTGQLVVMGHSYPLDWKLYRRQTECEEAGVPFFSKPQLAEEIVRSFEPFTDTHTYVLADSWYASQHLLDLCQLRQFNYIGAVKSNRKFSTSGHNHQVQQWVKLMPKNAFDRVKVKGKTYKLWSTVGQLASDHRVKLVVNRRHRHKKWQYLISTDLTLSPQTILSYYLIRWEVENFYRAVKQLLGWGDYQMRRLVAIERHVLLMMVAHAYLELQRQDVSEQVTDEDLHFTLGDLQRRQQVAARRATIALVFTLAQRDYDLETIYETLAA